DSPVEEAETESNFWDDGSENINPFGGRHPRYHDHHYYPYRNDHVVDRNNRYRDDPIRSMGLKIEIPEFTRKLKVETWEKMKKLMKDKFLPENHHQEAFLDYLNMSQRNMTIEDVINKFDKLRMRCDLVEEEEQLFAWFLGVLNPETADIVSLQPYWTYTDVCHLALKVEKHIKAKSKGTTSRFTPPTRIAPHNLGSRKTKHDGFQNTYRFKKDGVNITLIPFDSLQTHADGSNLFMKKTDFEGLVKTSPYEFADVIPDDIPHGLPAMRDIQHCIDFIPGSAILNRLAYRMNPKEFAKLQRQVTALLEKGLIPETTWFYHFFSKIDLRSGYYHIRMRPGDEWKTAFRTRDGLYEWMVMPFRLSNAPSTFMRLMNQVFKPFIGHFVVVYFDDILIYSSSLEQHLSHLRYIVTGGGIKIDPAKVKVIISWSTPSTIHDIRSFHELVFFYRRFIWNFSSIIAPLTECMKGGRFTWTSEAPKAFEILKTKVTKSLFLALPNFDEVFHVECDASRVGIGGVLSQNQRPIAFFSEKLNDPRRKYSIYDKEFYAIVCSLDTWRHYLLSNEFVLFSDHEDPDYKEIWSKCDNDPFQQFSKLDGYLFNGARLLERFHTYHIAKTHSSNAGLYTALSVPVASWEDMAHFVPCSKMFDAGQVARLYFVEIMKLHDVHKTLTSDRDVKFMSHFWRTLWTRLGSKLQFSSSRHPQTDGHTKVVNQSLGNLLRKVGQFSKEWADQSEQIKELHRLVREQIIRHNEQYKEHAYKRRKQVLYQEGDPVWIHLRKERFLAWRFGKLKPRGGGPFRVLKKINDNVYKIELPGHYNVFFTFNVADLSPYKRDSDDEPDLRSSLFQYGEDDADAVNKQVGWSNLRIRKDRLVIR
nr:hypothetical protein [Tanacetum cinerariifolium]